MAQWNTIRYDNVDTFGQSLHLKELIVQSAPLVDEKYTHATGGFPFH